MGFERVGGVSQAGGKGANLGALVRAGFPVPPGFVITTAAYDAFVAAHDLGGRIAELAGRADEPAIRELFAAGTVPADIAAAVRAACAELGTGPVAVRSSATAEDLEGASFAGQQDTFLNVRGPDAVLAAVVDCWASLWTARAMDYRGRQGIAPDAVSLAVVVQEMVEAESSGVLFTADPASGRRDRIAVSAAWGLGESVVGGLVGTDDHVVDRATGRVLSRRTADKTEMTVYAGAGTEQRPVPPERRRAPVLDDAAVTELARLGARIEEHFGVPQDVEWARAGGVFHVVQSRPITALPEPTGDVPATWPLPYPDGLYFRASIVEQMPDPLTPLFADLIDGSVQRSLGALMEEALGVGVLQDGDIGLPTINGYAFYHYRMTAFRRLLTRSPAAVSALFRRPPGERAPRGGVGGWRERSLPRYRGAVAAWSGSDVTGLDGPELLDGVVALLDAATVYYTAVQSIIPLAATSEIAFRAFYDRAVRRDGDPAGVTFLLGFDSEPMRAERSLYDLATAAAATCERGDVLEHFSALTRGASPEWTALLRAHLDRYGHTVYNLDFAEPVPVDDPAPVLDAVRFHLSGHGGDPHERQRRTAERREEQTRAVRARLDPARRAVFDRLLRWAQEIGPVREDALAEMGLAWPVMRRMLLELGRRLVADGVLAEPDEVFWLRADELRGARPVPAAAVAERRLTWRGQRLATPPQMLPDTGLVHRLSAPFMPAGDQNQTGAVITGVAASTGTVTAPARVLGGPADFAAMRPGEVLVARITTPAWTPLFAQAAAVVTDVGGPLSHGSIVAREYGIPAVLGTGSATTRIHSGQPLRVDGDAGTVTLLDEEDGPEPPRTGPDRTWVGPVGGAALGAAALVIGRHLRARATARRRT